MKYRTLATVQVASITGRPRLFHNWDVIGVRVRSEILATTMLAVEPMMVPLPPNPAPKASAHQSGWISSRRFTRGWATWRRASA